MRYFMLLTLLAAGLAFAQAPAPYTQFTWAPPTVLTDGTPITDPIESVTYRCTDAAGTVEMQSVLATGFTVNASTGAVSTAFPTFPTLAGRVAECVGSVQITTATPETLTSDWSTPAAFNRGTPVASGGTVSPLAVQPMGGLQAD